MTAIHVKEGIEGIKYYCMHINQVENGAMKNYFQQEAISQREIVFRFWKDIQSLRKAGILTFCA